MKKISISTFSRASLLAIAAVSMTFISPQKANAQLEITEIMYNPQNTNAWEWFEVRNTGGTDIDLDGAWMSKIGVNALNDVNNSPNIQSSQSQNTVIPAGGVAVLYDAYNYSGNAGNYDDQLFRDAWGLNASTPIVGVSFFPALSNSGSNRNFGLWPNFIAYEGDLDTLEIKVETYNNTLFNIDYSTFPTSTQGTSLTWDGNGSYQDAANWAESSGGTVTSIQTAGPINSTDDKGTPGSIPSGAATASGLQITEIMYNPRSPDPNFEWVEIYNNTINTIDFSSTPHVFDDTDDTDLTEANLTTGIIPGGGIAVLFNSDILSIADMQTMWDPGSSLGTNFIPVDENTFTALGNGGNTLAIWDSIEAYSTETMNNSDRTTDNAIPSTVVTYDNNDNSWPNDDRESSIQLTGSSQNDGSNWELTDVAGFSAMELIGIFHAGGDIASPGSFGTVATSADFDGDGDVDGSDFLAWQTGFGSGTTLAEGDADGDGDVDADDFGIWAAAYGSAAGTGSLSGSNVPEPSSLILIGLASLSLAFFARRK